MEINNISAIANLLNRPEVKTTSEQAQNFLGGLSALAGEKQKTDFIRSVYAGESKEFDFWAKDEKVAAKSFKYRTVEDALAEIDKVLRKHYES